MTTHICTCCDIPYERNPTIQLANPYDYMKLDDSGNYTWIGYHHAQSGQPISDLDTDGIYLYICAFQSVTGNYNVRKINVVDGQEIWAITGSAGCIALGGVTGSGSGSGTGSDSDILVVGDTGQVVRLDSLTGLVQWTTTFAGTGLSAINGLSVNPSTGDVIAVGTERIRSLDGGTGVVNWTVDILNTSNLLRVATNATSITVVGFRTASGTNANVWNYTLGGSLNWVADTTNTTLLGADIMRDVAYCPVNGNIVVTGTASHNFEDTFCYNSSGALQWKATSFGTGVTGGFGICTDRVDNVYVVGMNAIGSFSIVKYNSGGVVQWSKDFGFSHTGFDNCQCCQWADNYLYVGGAQITA